MKTHPDLPIDAVLPDLAERLRAGGNLVLQAPPGAGKTTRVPLALLEADWLGGDRIVMLEPRRVAARAAAERMAEMLDEKVGQTVGYRIRHETKVSRGTRIEVVTEGVLTRRLQSDPGLEGVGCVVFDEFHERSIHADLGLALCLEAQSALRPDIRLVAMSATLDGEAVAALMRAPIITSEGRSFPVETRWLDAPLKLDRRRRLEDAAAELVRRALEEEPGDALVFLPGAREIHAVESRLAGQVSDGVDILPIYGGLPFAKQQQALRPSSPGRRKVVLATAIAETSLTIEGVRIVIDAGRSRRARFDPSSGMSRLVTERASKAAAAQRRGRAGRLEDGVCYRLWSKGEEGALRAFDPPEIIEADLAPLALELAQWGAAPSGLPFLDAPPDAAFAQAVDLLRMLGALDAADRITAHGRAMASAPLHPRLAHMVLAAGVSDEACQLAALLEERDPLRQDGIDVGKRLAALREPHKHPSVRTTLERIADTARRLRRRLPSSQPRVLSIGALLALAYPDRIGLRRKGEEPRFLLSGGKGAALKREDPLGAERLIVAADLDGDAREAKVRLGAAVSLGEIEELFADQIKWTNVCEWSKRDRMVSARRRRMLGAVALEDQVWRDAPPEALGAAMADGVRQLGLAALPWSPAAERRVSRVRRASDGDAGDGDLPDWSDAALLDGLDAWLAPHLAGLRSATDLGTLNLHEILRSGLTWNQTQALDRIAPAHFETPLGGRAPIDYSGADPKVSIRLQELFGLDHHPTVAGAPILLELLSPAHRPIQTTADLPGFWRGSYADVRKDMRAKYPKHPWPEDPIAANPTRRAKQR
ncbi:MAG: ATP-dependent helicase HrpB [Pseudomonadota bacterium]